MSSRNFLLCSDDNYWNHLLVTVESIMATQNKDLSLNIYVLGNAINCNNKKMLGRLVNSRPNCKYYIYDVSDFKDRIEGKVNTELTINTYIRLFATEYLPEGIGKMIYLDVDIFVMQDLTELWDTQLGHNMIAAVKSTMDLKDPQDHDESHDHINAGVMLLDIDRWHEENVVDLFIKTIEEHHGPLPFHDGTVLNEAFKGRILYLPIKFNYTTPLRYLSYRRINSLYGLTSYYNREIYLEAKKNPVIIHATSWIMGRPWDMRSCSPYRKMYFDILKKVNIKTGEFREGVSSESQQSEHNYNRFSRKKENKMLVYSNTNCDATMIGGGYYRSSLASIRRSVYIFLRLIYYKYCPVFIVKIKKGIK